LNGNNYTVEFFNGFALYQNNNYPLMNSATHFLIEIAKTQKQSKRVLDLGCGQGAVGFAIAAYLLAKEVYSFDIQFSLLKNLSYSLQVNSINNFFLINGDYNYLSNLFPLNFFDNIYFNPPFYSSGRVSKNLSQAKSFFRKEFSLINIFKNAWAILKPKGNLLIVYPADKIFLLANDLMNSKFKIEELILYSSNNKKNIIKLCIIIAKKEGNTNLKIKNFKPAI